MPPKPTIGIVGFGDFGQFIAARLVQAGFRVLATSRSPYHSEAAALGVEFYQSSDAFCEAAPDVVLLATSILSTDKVLASLPLHKLNSSTLFVDVLSVKAYPKALLQAVLPPEADILCTHPMFGPVSGAGSWEGLTFMYDAVRIADTPASAARLASFLDFWAAEGCRLVAMTCEEHDRQAASTQFITHTVGRMLGGMDLSSTDINTRGFESLLQLVANTTSDSFDLYYGLFLYNNNALEQLERMEAALANVKAMLLDQRKAVARQQILSLGADGSTRTAAPAIAYNNILPSSSLRGTTAGRQKRQDMQPGHAIPCSSFGTVAEASGSSGNQARSAGSSHSSSSKRWQSPSGVCPRPGTRVNRVVQLPAVRQLPVRFSTAGTRLRGSCSPGAAFQRCVKCF